LDKENEVSGVHNPENLTFGADNRESRDRLRELILLIIERGQFDRSFGKTKLNKVVYYIDSLAFAKFGKSITGSIYEKNKYGPVPYGVERVYTQLVKNSDAAYSYDSGNLHRLVPQRESDVSIFSSKEVKLIEDIVHSVEGMSTDEIVRLSHGKAWEAVDMHEPIPYEATFLSDREYTQRDIERAHELINAGKWQD
jgi:uncharacterized phage-associated protein